MGQTIKRISSWIAVVLFLVGTALGLPVSDALLNVGQQGKRGGLDLSDDCEAEIKDIPIYGDISEPCERELENLHRKIEYIMKSLKYREKEEEN